MKSVCVFCGAQVGARPAYEAAIRALGTEIARRGMAVVYGGGHVGLMGALADAALGAGGEVVGVIPGALMERELGHGDVTRLEVVDSMHERKARMAELSDGFVAAPGGIGTMEELFEVWTWGQLGFHRKPLGFLEVESYFRPLLTFLDHARDEEFMRGHHRDMVLVGEDPAVLLDRMEAYEPPPLRFAPPTHGLKT